MTQGLQFSLLFNSLDAGIAADSAVFVPEKVAASSGEQAGEFGQLLASEQQVKAKQKGQTIAATSAQQTHQRASTSTVPPSSNNTNVTAIDAKAELFSEPSQTEQATPSHDVADQWLGLIRQSSDAASLLRQKAAQLNQRYNAEAVAINPPLVDDKPDADAVLKTVLMDTLTEHDARFLVGLSTLDNGEKATLMLPTAELLTEAAAGDGSNDIATEHLSVRPNAAALLVSTDGTKTAQSGEAAEGRLQLKTEISPSSSDKVKVPPSVFSSTEVTVQVNTVVETETDTQQASERSTQDMITPTPAALSATQPLNADIAALRQSEEAAEPSNEKRVEASSAALLETAKLTETSGVKNAAAESAASVISGNSSLAVSRVTSAALNQVPATESQTSNMELVNSKTKSESKSESKSVVSKTITLANSLTAEGAVKDSANTLSLSENSVVAAKNSLDATTSVSKLVANAVVSESSGTEVPEQDNLVLNDKAIIGAANPDSESRLTNVLVDKPLTSVDANSERAKTAIADVVTVADQNALEAAAARTPTVKTISPTSVNNAIVSTTQSETASSAISSQTLSQLSTDATEQQAQSDQQHSGRQDARQFNFARLEVALQQNNSAPAALAPAATSRESAEQTTALFRSEAFNSVLDQQMRPQATGSVASVTPALAAQLKQLNLQQQDASAQLRERVQLMVRQNIQVAEIRLDPAELGQMQIRINLQQEQASVQFIVQQQHAKELLEQQMPRLRELLQQQGMQLGEGQVQQQAKEERQSAGQQAGQGQQRGGKATEDAEGTPTVAMSVTRNERLVDYYA